MAHDRRRAVPIEREPSGARKTAASVLSQRFVAKSVMLVVDDERAKVARSVPEAKETAARLDTWRGFPTKCGADLDSFCAANF